MPSANKHTCTKQRSGWGHSGLESKLFLSDLSQQGPLWRCSAFGAPCIRHFVAAGGTGFSLCSIAKTVALALLLIGSAAAQVLSPAEILDPDMRALQERHFPELKAAAVEITSHSYPYRFYLSRNLDISEHKEQQSDQRAIRFSQFQRQIVVQVTGNYFASYSGRLMDRTERVKRTYLDVMMPIVSAIAPRLAGEPKVAAYAIEISHHVRKDVLGVTVENLENLAVIVPRSVAEKAAAGRDVVDQITALRASAVYVDGSLVSLWPEQSEASWKDQAPKPELVVPAEPAPAPAPAPIAPDLSPTALQQKQSSYQELLDRIVRELDSSAHFVSYSPPVLVVFHKTSYLQLSITTTLGPSAVGSQYRIAALAFDNHISHLIRPLLAFFKEDPDFEGVLFSATVKIPSVTQSVEFFLPFRELRRYETYDITGQQLINSGYVLINGERVGLDLQAAEADVR